MSNLLTLGPADREIEAMAGSEALHRLECDDRRGEPPNEPWEHLRIQCGFLERDLWVILEVGLWHPSAESDLRQIQQRLLQLARHGL